METYITDDLPTASFLLTKGAKILEVKTDRPNHFVFVFEDSDRCNVLKIEFVNNGSAPARELFARREELISEIKNRNGDRNGETNGKSYQR